MATDSLDFSGNGSPIVGTQQVAEQFTFAQGYRPLNHGSFGAFPKVVQERQRQLQAQSEERPDTFIRYTYLDLLRESRSAIATLLGADPGEVVFIPNATTGVNTVLRNLSFQPLDVIMIFDTVYGACAKTIQSISEHSQVTAHVINISYPIEDHEILAKFSLAIEHIQAQGKHPKLAMFDAVLTFPGARFPWETLVAKCKEFDILSLIDGAHGVGHIDLAHLACVGPDFFVSNCYK